jgi:hypothetical protein
MEQDFLHHPGTVLVGHASKKRNVPATDSTGKRHQRGASTVGSAHVTPDTAGGVPVEDDFEPLTSIDMQVAAGVPPIYQAPNTQNKDRFEPTNWRTKGPSGVVTQDGNILKIPSESYNGANTGGKFGFGFHPENVLGKDWVNSHSMKIGMWLRNTTISFAKTLSGKLGFKSVNDVLETGFEDLNSLIREAQMTSSDLPSTSNPVSGTPIPPQLPPTFSQSAPSKAMYELWRVAQMVSTFGSTSDSVQFYRYLTSRAEKREALYNRWLTLPSNLSEIHFIPVVYSGIEAALDRITLSFDGIPRDNLFAEILRSQARETFAELVVLFIQRDRFINPNGDRRKHTGEMLEARIDTALERFGHLNLRPIRGPEEETTVKLKPEEELKPVPTAPVVKREPVDVNTRLLRNQRLAFNFM